MDCDAQFLLTMGHYCWVCGCSRPNEKFSGKGHRNHVCRDCRRLPKERIERIGLEDELFGFVMQSHISDKNLKRLKLLTEYPDAEIRKMAELLIRVGAIAPYKRKRWSKVREADPELHTQCVRLDWTSYPY